MKVINCRRKVMNTSETKETKAFGGESNHKGADLIPKSTNETPNILAYDSGVVIATGNVKGVNHSTGTAGMGTYIAIKHDNGLVTRYQHLKYNCNKVVKGERVKQGQAIGVYGRPETGNAYGSHLHFDVSAPTNIGGKVISGTFCGEKRYYIDPIPYLELKTGTITSAVNIRTGAGTNYKIVGEKQAGEGVTIYGISGSWYRISPNLPRWIHKNYVREW